MAINLITGRIYPKIKDVQFPNFKSVQAWWNSYDKKKGYQLDLETNITNDITQRVIYTVQIGDLKGETQLIFDLPELPKPFFDLIMEILNEDCPKYIQYAMFEYMTIKQVFKIDITQIRDTYLQSRLLTCGLPIIKGRDSLKGIAKRVLNIEIDKGNQTSFTGELLTEGQIEYAALDVAILFAIYEKQNVNIVNASIQNTLTLEEKAVRSLGDIEVNGMRLNVPKWVANTTVNENTLQVLENEMVAILRSPELFEKVQEKNLITATDTYLFKWTSPKQKLQLLQLDMPELTSSAMVYLKKHLKRNEVTPGHERLINLYLEREYDGLAKYYINNWKSKLNAMDIFTPKGNVNINFGSPAQMLDVFKIIKPGLIAANATALAYIDHELVNVYKKYAKVSKALGSFGHTFLDGLGSDGKIHPSIRQVLDTGRISMSSPVKNAGSGLQQIPADNKYRNCFEADPGRTFISIDYSSAELCIIAEWSGDKTMIDALRAGKDLHSVTTSLLFPELWKEAGEDPDPIGKPSSAEGKKLRNWAKSTAFGIVYGTTAVGLAERLNLPPGFTQIHKLYPKEIKEAKQRFKVSTIPELKILFNDNKFLPHVVTADKLIKRYFSIYPSVQKGLIKSASDGINKLYTRTMAPFHRLRIYAAPLNRAQSSHIERQAQNAVIQGTSADITKAALVMIKKELHKYDARLILQLHDEILCDTPIDKAEEWAVVQAEIMNKAAKLVIKSGLLKVDSPTITPYWEKG